MRKYNSGSDFVYYNSIIYEIRVRSRKIYKSVESEIIVFFYFTDPRISAGTLFIFVIRKTKMRMSTTKPTSYGSNYFSTFVSPASKDIRDILLGSSKILSETRERKMKRELNFVVDS